MSNYTSYQEIKSALESNDGLMSISMGELRDAHDVLRLGVHVRTGIHDRLQGMGIGHFPEELPDYQDQNVRLYTLGSPFAKILNDLFDFSQAADDRLRERIANDYEERLQKIKELVL